MSIVEAIVLSICTEVSSRHENSVRVPVSQLTDGLLKDRLAFLGRRRMLSGTRWNNVTKTHLPPRTGLMVWPEVSGEWRPGRLNDAMRTPQLLFVSPLCRLVEPV